jgi:uncharacterized protein (TIGR03503 family)
MGNTLTLSEMTSKGRCCGKTVLLLMLLLPQWLSAAEEKVVVDAAADTRVLIDVSGSMKENDPENLRQPALRLLVGLLPKDSRSAVWTFGQFVNEEIPLGKVDKGWRDRARESAGKIHSRGLFTDIEQVLKRSTEDWKKASSKYARHLVLLTDGMVDISKSSLKNAASRRRIVSEILPQLKKLGVRVHSIALSKKADHRLLKKLSAETDGWYEQVDDAERLKRIFLRIFEKVAKPDSVPLKDNRFQIDKSVKEATLLVFRKDGSEPTQVLMPNGSSFSSENPPEGVSWHRDDGYDLLTITNPEAGEWQIQAEVDPDNRVLVVTDLKMISNNLPNRLLQGELQALKIHFTDQGKKITSREFLDVVNIKSEYVGSDGSSEPRPVFDDGKAGDKTAADGVFTHMTGKDIGKGKIELVMTAEGKTFVRERRFTFESIPAVTIERMDGERSGNPGLIATVVPEPNLVDGQSVRVDAYMVPEEGEPVATMFLPGPDGMSQETWIDRSGLKGNWNLEVQVKATSVSGNELELVLDPVPIKGLEPAPEPQLEPEPAVTVETPKPEPMVEPEPQPEPEAATEPEVATPEAGAPESAEDGTGISSVIWFSVLNLLVLLAGGGAFWFFRKRRAAIYAELIDEDEDGEGSGSHEQDEQVKAAEVAAAPPAVDDTLEEEAVPLEEEPAQLEGASDVPDEEEEGAPAEEKQEPKAKDIGDAIIAEDGVEEQ